MASERNDKRERPNTNLSLKEEFKVDFSVSSQKLMIFFCLKKANASYCFC